MTSLYNKYRPKTLDELVGQPTAVTMLQKWLAKKNLPHAILLTGASGTGKTTIARILGRELGCRKKLDYIEQNCANFRGIDSIRDIDRMMRASPVGDAKVYVLDEVHQITSQSQSALLKMLEDTPDWVYFILCTTDGHKLLKTIHTRCSEVKLREVDPEGLVKLINRVAKAEGKKMPEEVTDRIVDCADGSPRKALVILQAIIGLDSPRSQIETVEKTDSRRDSIEIARALLNPRTRWPDMAKILREADLSEPESLRHLVLAYASTVLLSNGNLSPRAAMIISVFRDNLFDSKKSGFLLYCWQIVAAK